MSRETPDLARFRCIPINSSKNVHINEGFALSRGTGEKERADGKIHIAIKIYTEVKSSSTSLFSGK